MEQGVFQHVKGLEYGSMTLGLNTGLFHIIIVNYDDIPDDLVVKVILARNTLHLVTASMSIYDAQITW